MRGTKIIGGAIAGLVVVVMVVALPDTEVPAIPPPVTLRSEAERPERDRNSLVIVPEPVFEGVPGDDSQTPIEMDSPDDPPEPSPLSDDDSGPEDSPDETSASTLAEDVEDGSALPVDSADTVDSPDLADSPDD